MVRERNEQPFATYLVPGTGQVMLLTVCPARLTSFPRERADSNPVLSNHVVFITYIKTPGKEVGTLPV